LFRPLIAVIKQLKHCSGNQFSFLHSALGITSRLQPHLSIDGLAIFNPTDDKPVDLKRANGKVTFTVRDFDVHEVVVITAD
jgi:hypothetical protein